MEELKDYGFLETINCRGRCDVYYKKRYKPIAEKSFKLEVEQCGNVWLNEHMIKENGTWQWVAKLDKLLSE